MRRNLVGVVATLAAALGCSGGTGATGHPAPDEGAEVRVENSNWMDVNVYAVRSGTTRRLGTVTTNSIRVFRLPSSFLEAGGQVQLLIDPIGSTQTRLMPAVSIMSGDRIDLDVFNHLPLSSISVLPRRF